MKTNLSRIYGFKQSLRSTVAGVSAAQGFVGFALMAVASLSAAAELPPALDARHIGGLAGVRAEPQPQTHAAANPVQGDNIMSDAKGSIAAAAPEKPLPSVQGLAAVDAKTVAPETQLTAVSVKEAVSDATKAAPALSINFPASMHVDKIRELAGQPPKGLAANLDASGNTQGQPQAVPSSQMDLIKDVFAPELSD